MDKSQVKSIGFHILCAFSTVHTQIVVSLVNGRPGAMNFSYSPVLREFTKATNIRLRFLRTNTLLGHLMGKALRDPTVTRRVRCNEHETLAIITTEKDINLNRERSV